MKGLDLNTLIGKLNEVIAKEFTAQLAAKLKEAAAPICQQVAEDIVKNLEPVLKHKTDIANMTTKVELEIRNRVEDDENNTRA